MMPQPERKSESIQVPSDCTKDVRPAGKNRTGFREAFSAFSHRNYRIFFGGQVISLIGTWLQSTAEGWLVYELSGSTVALGAIRLAHMLPFALLALWGGIVADRVSKRKILLFTQSASMLLALLLALLVFLGIIEVWHVALIAIGLGITNAFDVPTRQAFVIELVGKKDLINGIALNSSMFNLARVVGPALAGVLIGIVGMAGCFLINGLSYIAVLFGYSILRLPEHEKKIDHPRYFEAIREAFVYIWNDKPIRSVMTLISTFSLFGTSFVVLMPVFAKDILKGDATSFGILMAANGLGALVGGLTLASKARSFNRRTLIYSGLIACCILLALFAISKSFWLSCAILVCSGFFMIIFFATANTATQLRSPDKLRGRIMGFYALSFLGTSSIGSLISGWLAKIYGAPTTILISVSICLAVALYVKTRQIPIPSE
ncbi:MAG: MFS transporter [Akkermansiaceae bacterium]